VTDILIVVDGEPHELEGKQPFSAPLSAGIAVLKQAILASDSVSVAGAALQGAILPEAVQVSNRETQHPAFWVPMTLNVPLHIDFPGQALYQLCRDVGELRQRVTQLGYAVGTGQFWLPVVLTRKGPLYGEVIGRTEAAQYAQPFHLPDRWRQPIYRLGQALLRSLTAPPSVYLIQFGFQGETICFDRLLPFPAEPAIASLGVQVPDLFTCYWRCLTHQPVTDLIITASNYQIFDPAVSVSSH
jgi:hypothetical protein